MVNSKNYAELLAKSLTENATSADVKRLYKVREVLSSENWDSPDILPIKSQLVSCFESRVFYKSAEGVNFLALVMNLHPLMLPPINEVLKRVVLSWPVNLLSGACSQLLLKAWNSSSGGQKILIEQSIMEWMRKALLSPVKTAERVRLLLYAFHHTTRTAEIDELLARYYGPVLFRHTKVANWEVRFNAIGLLVAAFPVLPPDRAHTEFEEKLSYQFRVLKEAMEDPSEAVRKMAVGGTGKILRVHWEVLSIEQIAMVLDTLVEKCSRDKYSVATQMQVIDALSCILENPLTHSVMAELLPSTKNLLNDDSDRVRLHYADFLVNKLTKCRTIPIVSIIAQEMLLTRIATEHAIGNRNIASLLTSIVAPSVFVSDVKDQCERCFRMSEGMPQIFLAIIMNLGSAIPEVKKIKLAVALLDHVIKRQPENILAPGGAMSRTTITTILVNKVLLRAVAELLRSTKFSNVQGSEDAFSGDDAVLANYIYRFLVDRDIALFGKQLQLEFEENYARESVHFHSPLVELLDVLSILDGCRLPLCYKWLSEPVHENLPIQQLVQEILSAWS